MIAFAFKERLMFKLRLNIFRKGRNGKVNSEVQGGRCRGQERVKDKWISFLLKCLLYQGLLDRTLKKRLSVNAWIVLVIVNVYACHSVCLWAHNITKFTDTQNFLYQNLMVTEVLSIAYLVNITFLNRNLVSNCFDVLRDARRIKSKRYFIKSYQFAFLMTNIGRMVSYLIQPCADNETVSEYVQFLVYDLEALKSNHLLASIVVRIDCFFYYYVTCILGFVFQSVVMFSVDTLRINVSKLALNLSYVDCDVREMCLEHTNLFATIRTLDNDVRGILCVWVLQWAVNFYYFLLSFKHLEQYGYIEVLYTFASIFTLFVLLITMSLLSHSGGSLLKSFHLRYVKRPRQIKSRNRLATELFLMRSVRTAILHFTVFKSFVLSPGFIEQLSAAIISYASFVISSVDFDEENLDLSNATQLNDV